MQHHELTAELSEHISLYAIGALDSDALREFTRHLDDCSVCRQELHAMQSTLGLLGYHTPAVAPPGGLKARVLARVQTATPAASRLPLLSAQAELAALTWEPSAYPGVDFHALRQDAATGTITAFVKIQPGSRYPLHRHRGGEDCLVLRGGFQDGRGEYHAGDFVYYEPGSLHHDFQALAGEECWLFVVAHGGLEILSTFPSS